MSHNDFEFGERNNNNSNNSYKKKNMICYLYGYVMFNVRVKSCCTMNICCFRLISVFLFFLFNKFVIFFFSLKIMENTKART